MARRRYLRAAAFIHGCLILSAIAPTNAFPLGFSMQVTQRETRTQPKTQDCLPTNHHSRRQFASTLPVAALSILPVLTNPQRANAGWFDQVERRELSLCLVNLLRLQYWAETESRDLKIYRNNNDSGRLQQLYVQTRLGAKAAVTGKVGGGATNRVYTIASLKFRETLDDLTWYAGKAKNTIAIQLIHDLVESLASLVEFDGLESTQDASPRSSLMISKYDTRKLEFVSRMLAERIIPTAQTLFQEFDLEVRRLCLNYVQTNYPNEIPEKSVSPSPSEPTS